MYREMLKYEEENPSSKWSKFLGKIYDNAVLFFFEKYLHTVKLGSPKWHKIQNWLLRGPACGLGMKMRVMFYERTLIKCGKNLLIYPDVFIAYPQELELGDTVLINWGCHITAKAHIKIGNYALIGPYTIINSGQHKYHDPSIPIRHQGHKIGPITIEDDVWIGAHVCILPNVTIGRGAIIGANSVVTSSIEPYAIAVGNPAKPILFRRP